MKKKVLISFIMALLAVMLMASPIFASDVDVDVSVSDISIDSVVDPILPNWVTTSNGLDGSYFVGTVITVSGTVTIVATADPQNPFGSYNAYGEAESDAQVTVTNPDGSVTILDSNSEYKYDNSHPESATASQTFSWSATVTLTADGTYVITQSGEAYAEWAYTTGQWVFVGHFPWGHWEWVSQTTSGGDSDTTSSSLSVRAKSIPDKPIPWLSSGGFTVYMNDQFLYYKTVGYTAPISKTLSGDLSADFDGVKVFIPSGTVVNKTGVVASCLGIKYLDGKLSFITQFMSFSNPVIITLPDGETVAFKNIVNGVAEPLLVELIK